VDGHVHAVELHRKCTFRHGRSSRRVRPSVLPESDDQTIRIRDIAARCRLTERAVQKVISDLEQDGYLTRTRRGRANSYRIEPGTILRHSADAGSTVAALLPHRAA
jgi:predicted transcriptional regulator of viral defense system